MESNEVAITATPAELKVMEDSLPTSINFFANKEMFDHVQRVAIMFSKSDLVPKTYKGNIGNCIIALDMATRMNANPLMVMQNLDIIQGKPGWSSKFLIASLNQCGKFSPLRYEEDEQQGGRTRAYALDKSNGEKLYGVWITMEMAKAEGWIDKAGSKWKTMPAHMRRYRAASFFTNEYAPEISMGFPTTDEIVDIQYADASSVDVDHEDLNELFLLKYDELSPAEIVTARAIIDGKETKSYKKLQDMLKTK